MNEDLKQERDRTSFDTKELSTLLYRGEENFNSLKRIGMSKCCGNIFEISIGRDTEWSAINSCHYIKELCECLGLQGIPCCLL